MPPIRRLTVLQDASTTDEDRPAWHWTIIGLLFVYSIFAPLAMVANWVGQRMVQSRFADAPVEEIAHHLAAASASERLTMWLAVSGAPVLAYALSCVASGLLVGRFGAKAGPREAARSGVLAGVVAGGLVLAESDLMTALGALALLLPLGGATTWVGGSLGLRLRKASTLRAPPPPTRNV